MDSHGDEGQAAMWCQTQDQNEVPVYWIRLHLAAFISWRAGKSSLKDAVKWRKDHFHASLILPIEILGRGFSLTSNVVLLNIVEREKWIIYNLFSLVFKMLQFQSTCKYKAHVANTCVHKQASRKISWLCRFWCQVLQWSESVSFLYEILLRPFGPAPYGLIDIASPSSCGLTTPWPWAIHHSDSLTMQRWGRRAQQLGPLNGAPFSRTVLV